LAELRPNPCRNSNVPPEPGIVNAFLDLTAGGPACWSITLYFD
jgi:hypothetical protein